jgi:hypothetical protein
MTLRREDAGRSPPARGSHDSDDTKPAPRSVLRGERIDLPDLSCCLAVHFVYPARAVNRCTDGPVPAGETVTADTDPGYVPTLGDARSRSGSPAASADRGVRAEQRVRASRVTRDSEDLETDDRDSEPLSPAPNQRIRTATESDERQREPLPAGALPLHTRDPNRYEIVQVHGIGGIGRVVRAHDRELDRTVALKELRRSGTDSESRFVREALITAKLQHPGIVPIHEAGTHQADY